MTRAEEPLAFDLDGKAIVNSAGQPYRPPVSRETARPPESPGKPGRDAKRGKA